MALLMLNLPDSMAGNRMLSKKEASLYCRIPVNKFSAVCPVSPIDLGSGLLSYDRNDLDKWIDGAKQTTQAINDDDIIKRLEAAV